MYRSIPHMQTIYMQSFIISHSSCADQYGDMSADTQTHSHTHTHSHTNKPPKAGVQLVGYTVSRPLFGSAGHSERDAGFGLSGMLTAVTWPLISSWPRIISGHVNIRASHTVIRVSLLAPSRSGRAVPFYAKSIINMKHLMKSCVVFSSNLFIIEYDI